MIVEGVSALTSAFNLAKGLKEIDDRVRLNSAVIELQALILQAQEAQQNLRQKNEQLEKEIAGFQTWDAKQKRYVLRDYGEGTFAYELTAEGAQETGEPTHRACPKCFQERHFSILQHVGKDAFKRDHMRCPHCKSDFALGVRHERNLGVARRG